MRRYLQGTLDFACGIYAVINAFSHVHGLNLAGARRIYRESQLELAADRRVWRSYVGNETDHYWLVRHMLRRWSLPGRALNGAGLTVICPFDGQIAPGEADENIAAAEMYLPERHPSAGPLSLAEAEAEALLVWQTLMRWFEVGGAKRAALLRFHRFLPMIYEPVVSHWSCVRAMDRRMLYLLDASAEDKALHELDRHSLMPGSGERALLRIVPESLFLLSG